MDYVKLALAKLSICVLGSLPLVFNVTVSTLGKVTHFRTQSTTTGIERWCHSVVSVSNPTAHQAPLSMAFPRQEHRSVFPFPSPGDLPNPGIEPKSLALVGRFFTTETPEKPLCCVLCLVAQSSLNLCNPMDCSQPGSSVQEISQARIQEWVAISFSRGSS